MARPSKNVKNTNFFKTGKFRVGTIPFKDGRRQYYVRKQSIDKMQLNNSYKTLVWLTKNS